MVIKLLMPALGVSVLVYVVYTIEKFTAFNKLSYKTKQLIWGLVFGGMAMYVMTIISGLCNSNPQKADDALILFARYLRKNIAIMDRDEPIFFSQELQHLEDYISLEKLRFGEKISFQKNLEVTDFKIPPLTIQPLVENAIKHGLLAPGKKGTVTLSSRAKEDDILITIEDDGSGFTPEVLEKENAVGIRNVRYRIENMVGGILEIISVPGEGTRVQIRLPRNRK